MRTTINAVLGGEGQARRFECRDCSTPTPPTGKAGRHKTMCVPCALNRRRKADLARYHKRQGNEAAASVGTQASCADCSAPITKTRSDHTLCARCKQDRTNKINRERREIERRSAGKPIKAGVLLACEHCSITFEKRAYNQRLCRACKYQPIIRYTRARRKVDPVFALNGNISAAIRKSLGGRKNGAWEKLLGYTIQDLKVHLERQFLPGMTWKNKGEWEVDHRRPIASFSFTKATDPDFLACWSMHNLQPMWRDDNRAKSDQRLFLI